MKVKNATDTRFDDGEHVLLEKKKVRYEKTDKKEIVRCRVW